MLIYLARGEALRAESIFYFLDVDAPASTVAAPEIPTRPDADASRARARCSFNDNIGYRATLFSELEEERRARSRFATVDRDTPAVDASPFSLSYRPSAFVDLSSVIQDA